MSETKVRAIAFYLPQFHPIPENNKWWGEGFTEWTNVKKAKPLFRGHYQPQEPDDEIGYYDLRDASIREKQAQLARIYGIYGFCYYYYWFGGKKLLETPLREVLKSGKPDFPFCICWANENWTRRWDGKDSEILIAQNHSDEDDRAFIVDLVPVFKDPRYIRVHGKPILIIYRTELFPDIKRSAQIWRNTMREAGIGEIYLARVEGHTIPVDPNTINFDASIEFAPDFIRSQRVKRKSIRHRDYSLDLFQNDKLNVYDYEINMLRMLAKPTPTYTLFRGVYPGWDNTPRRNTSATIFINSGPDHFEYFLKRQLQYTYEHYSGDDRMLFINAWNEWGEGCHLEPDKRQGKAYLEICRKLLEMPEEIIIQKNDFEKRIENLELCITESLEDLNMLDSITDEMKYWKTSKFWKMRELYMKTKRTLCLWKRK